MSSETLICSIRESFGRVVYSHKTHEKQIELLSRNLTIARWAEAILISLTAGGTISILFGRDFCFQLVTAILASIATAVTIYQLSFDPERIIREHRKSARLLWLIREKYINLIADLVDESIDEEEGRSRRDKILKELHEVYLDSPDTSIKAYSYAQKALKIDEELTFSDEEIDSFLPTTLRKNK